ncbi:hypothetical protein NLJ89_g4439 [Agrocybe chaxingu]|uniref:Uncharacterized protein n=1 Tax=Agrocybe chaxingu TaxID=84603 RepID=A0A9W8K3A9_9AGAR|nr:hypothetical protein NLJ89_g4439 [Agrocybe chaxingu]
MLSLKNYIWPMQHPFTNLTHLYLDNGLQDCLTLKEAMAMIQSLFSSLQVLHLDPTASPRVDILDDPPDSLWETRTVVCSLRHIEVIDISPSQPGFYGSIPFFFLHNLLVPCLRTLIWDVGITPDLDEKIDLPGPDTIRFIPTEHVAHIKNMVGCATRTQCYVKTGATLFFDPQVVQIEELDIWGQLTPEVEVIALPLSDYAYFGFLQFYISVKTLHLAEIQPVKILAALELGYKWEYDEFDDETEAVTIYPQLEALTVYTGSVDMNTPAERSYISAELKERGLEELNFSDSQSGRSDVFVQSRAASRAGSDVRPTYTVCFKMGNLDGLVFDEMPPYL